MASRPASRLSAGCRSIGCRSSSIGQLFFDGVRDAFLLRPAVIVDQEIPRHARQPHGKRALAGAETTSRPEQAQKNILRQVLRFGILAHETVANRVNPSRVRFRPGLPMRPRPRRGTAPPVVCRGRKLVPSSGSRGGQFGATPSRHHACSFGICSGFLRLRPVPCMSSVSFLARLRCSRSPREPSARSEVVTRICHNKFARIVGLADRLVVYNGRAGSPAYSVSFPRPPYRTRVRRWLPLLAVSGLAVLIAWFRAGSGLSPLIGMRSGRFTGAIHWGWMAISCTLVLRTYLARVLRWRMMIRPLRARRRLSARMFKATAIGFTAVVLFGRPGEFVRPWLIARSGTCLVLLPDGGLVPGTGVRPAGGAGAFRIWLVRHLTRAAASSVRAIAWTFECRRRVGGGAGVRLHADPVLAGQSRSSCESG